MIRIILTLLFICISFFALGKEAHNNYRKSFIYNHFVEPFLGLDQILEDIDLFQVTQCRVVSEGLSHEEQVQYSDLGSCLYHEIPVFSEQEKSKKNVVIYTLVGKEQSFDLMLSWTSFSFKNLLNSYRNDDPQELSVQIHLTGVKSYSLSDFLLALIEERGGWNAREILEPSMDQNFKDKDVSETDLFEMQLNLIPYEEDLLNIKINFLSEDQTVIYSFGVVTNYYIGAGSFFVIDEDQYNSRWVSRTVSEQSGEKTH